jgi:pimeloyl-ACP methyl ester carboxylesterase
MRRARSGSLQAAIAVVIAFLGTAATVLGAESERVRFITADFVEIQGLYYPGDQGIKSPAVIMLHPLGSSIEAPGWSDLAKKLQEKHFAVLTFDFRGHGGSVSVTPQFWTSEPTNQQLKSFKGPKSKSTISNNDFKSAANMVSFINDICAAKRYLDTKNDGSECNSAKTFVVGAGSGATLGAVWINSEWRRRAVKTGFPVVNNNQPEGHDIAGAAWLSMSSTVSSGGARWSPRLESLLTNAQVRDNIPMLFLYGEQDAKAASLAKSLHGGMVRGLKDKKVKDLDKLMGLKDTKLAGVELLGKPSLGTEGTIIKYFEEILETRTTNPWGKKDVDKTVFTVFPINAYLR